MKTTNSINILTKKQLINAIHDGIIEFPTTALYPAKFSTIKGIINLETNKCNCPLITNERIRLRALYNGAIDSRTIIDISQMLTIFDSCNAIVISTSRGIEILENENDLIYLAEHQDISMEEIENHELYNECIRLYNLTK